MNRTDRPYVNPYVGGVLLGVVLFLAFVVTGAGLGASGGLNHFQVALLNIFDHSHVERVGYMATMLGAGGLESLNNWEVFMILGMVLGGALSGWLNGRLRLEVRKGPQISSRTRLLLAFAGGLIMNYGARMSRGCTSGQALTGGAVLSAGSFAFMFAVFGGAYALAWFLRRAWN